MRRLLLAVGLIATLIAPAADAGHVVCVEWSGTGAPPQCHDRAIPVPPGVSLGTNDPDGSQDPLTEDGVITRVRVLLPNGYDDPANATKEYPVLYLLHGAGDTYATWTQNTDLLHHVTGNGFEVIVVMPDGGCNPGNNPKCHGAGWYSDWADGTRNYETFHIDVLVPWVDATYRTQGDGHRGIAGLSMGGFGALKYAARHWTTPPHPADVGVLPVPGVSEPLFSAAASFSGVLDPWHGAPVTGLFYEYFSSTISPGTWGEPLTGESLLDAATDQIVHAPTWQENSPASPQNAARLSALDIPMFLTVGTGTPHANNGNAPDVGEHLIFQTNASFVRAMAGAGRVPDVTVVDDPGAGEIGVDLDLNETATGAPYELRTTLGEKHRWSFWETSLHWALPQLLEQID